MTVRRRAGLLAVVATACATAWPMQGGGNLQNAHYALVRALADGRAAIGAELGELPTNDVALVDGRAYSNKPPGLAFATLPVFVVLNAAGAVDHTRILWGLGLLGAVLPAAGAAALLWRAGERLEPGYGAAAAVSLGLGTLLLPFATLFVHHALAASLSFAAFVALWRSRSLASVAGAGVVAGLAVVAEYSAAIPAAVLAVYAATAAPRARRAAAWLAGVAVGAIPLAVYNAAVFGSVFETSYGVDPSGRAPRLFGVPSLDVALELLFSTHGLLVLSPVLAAGAAGLWLLARRGLRAEAAACGAIALGYLVFNAAFYSPFGGFSPGPRYLIAASVFLAVGLPTAFRAAPLATGALAAASATAMLLLTATHPQAGYDWRWLDRLLDGDVPLTAASLVGVTGSIAIVPLFLAALAAVLLAALVAPRDVPPLAPLAAGAALAAWVVVALAAPETGRAGDYASYLPAALVVAAAVAVPLGLAKR